ncbi:Nif11-like leader peptide family natural product precursor [Tistrella mobilis]|uniref:Nif11-like leader peptide family natural product precursor n=1 Tax=Tistrella mobilis TaxID=171437 RepID=UPI003556AA8F
MSQDFDKLKDIIQSNPDLLSEGGDIGAAARRLEDIARANGLDLDAAEIERQFQARAADGRPDDELDDQALDQVAGAGSPWCMFTNGCYCFFTK